MPDAANSLLLLTAEESADEARARLLAQVTAAAAAAPGAGKHLAHGHPRDVALPAGRGAVALYQAPEHAEEQLSVFSDLLGRLAGVLDPGHAQSYGPARASGRTVTRGTVLVADDSTNRRRKTLRGSRPHELAPSRGWRTRAVGAAKGGPP